MKKRKPFKLSSLWDKRPSEQNSQNCGTKSLPFLKLAEIWFGLSFKYHMIAWCHLPSYRHSTPLILTLPPPSFHIAQKRAAKFSLFPVTRKLSWCHSPPVKHSNRRVASFTSRNARATAHRLNRAESPPTRTRIITVFSRSSAQKSSISYIHFWNAPVSSL